MRINGGLVPSPREWLFVIRFNFEADSHTQSYQAMAELPSKQFKRIFLGQHISWLRPSIIAYLIDAPVLGPRICLHATALPQLASAPPNKTTCPSCALLFPPRIMVTYFAPNYFSCASHSKMPSPSCSPSVARRARTCTSSPSPASCIGWVPSNRVGPRSMKLTGSI